MSNINHVIFGIHSVIGESEIEDKSWTDEQEYAVIADSELGLTVNPFPLNPCDLLHVGGQIIPDFEDLVDSCNHVLEECETNLSQHFCGAHKAIIPIAWMRELVDEDNTVDTITYRCPDCSKCVVCKPSCRRTAISLQESAEQTIIESSVKLDLENQRVLVTLPWVRDPIQPLIDKHRGTSNIHQALRVYKPQCIKGSQIKEKVRLAHSELVEQDFMTKLSELPAHLQEFIRTADFNHYYCWRVVYKEDSQSTPVRLVADPTMRCLNILLAKGENNLGNIFDLLVRSRTNQFSWAADISKLYNMLHLDYSPLPFSIFLYHTSMDANIEPDVYIMTRAWYGVVPTGAQAAVAIRMLAELSSGDHPDALDVLLKDIYVNDVNPGAENETG